MRLTIGRRLLIAFTLTSLLILGLNAVLMRLSFERGFLDYLTDREVAHMTHLAEALAALHSDGEKLDTLQSNPRRWADLVRRTGSGPSPSFRRPERLDKQVRPESRPGRGGHPPPPPDLLGILERIVLKSASGEVIIGRIDGETSYRTVPVVANGVQIGELLMLPAVQLTSAIDVSFAEEQMRSTIVIAGIALVAAAIAAFVISRQITRPLGQLEEGARAMSAGDYKVRINTGRKDELGNLAREFNHLSDMLFKNQEARRRWVADIAHELRTPLSILRGEIQAMEDGVRPFNNTSRQSLESEVNRLTMLVGDLHDLMASDEGSLSYEFEIVDFGKILRKVLESARGRVSDAGLELEYEISSELLNVSADQRRLEQLIINILENSIRYTDSPGQLRVRCHLEGDHVVVNFADSAPAVPEESLSKLFDRLYRVDESRSRATGGAGLGLSICDAIVKAHSGEICAYDSDLGGITISVRLPCDVNGISKS